jgi:hypothetical protein
MKVGDRTHNGTIVNILDANEYLKIVADYGYVDFSQWDNQFPGWRDEQVAVVVYDEPQKQGTFEEYWDFRKGEVDFATAEEEYENLPKYPGLTAPVQTLILEDNNE